MSKDKDNIIPFPGTKVDTKSESIDKLLLIILAERRFAKVIEYSYWKIDETISFKLKLYKSILKSNNKLGDIELRRRIKI